MTTDEAAYAGIHLNRACVMLSTLGCGPFHPTLEDVMEEIRKAMKFMDGADALITEEFNPYAGRHPS